MSNTKLQGSVDHKLRILIIEENSADVESLERGLRAVGIGFSSVYAKSVEEYRKTLTDFSPDIIILNRDLPGLDGTTVFSLAQELAPGASIVATGVSSKGRVDSALIAAIGAGQAKNAKRLTEEALIESENKFQSLYNAVAAGVIVEDSNGVIVHANRTACRILGISENEMMGRTSVDPRWHTIREDGSPFPGEEHPAMVTMRTGHPVRNVLMGIYSPQFEGHRWILVNSEPLLDPKTGELKEVLATFVDITDHKSAEKSLTKRLSFERMMAEVSSRAVMVEDVTSFLDECMRLIGEATDVSRAYIFECHTETDTMDNTVEWTAPGIEPQIEHLQGLRAEDFPFWMKMLLEDETINYSNIEDIPSEPERDILRMQGIKSVLVVPLYVNQLLWGFMGFDECRTRRTWPEEDAGVLETVAEIISGVIERRCAERALRESERKYRELVEESQEGIWAVDATGYTTFVNTRMAEMLGYTVDEMLGNSLCDFVCGRRTSWGIRSPQLYKPIEDGTFDAELIRKDGTQLYVRVQAKPLFDDEGNYRGSTAYITDCTEKRKLEAQLRMANRLEAIGRMTGGVSHEFKNLLMGISGYAEILQIKLGPDHPENTTVNDLLHCVDRASRLISQLLAFSRKQIIDPQPTDLNNLVADSEHLVERLLGEPISLSIELSPTPMMVDADPGQIEQVIVNMALNARDAMPDGGRFAISVGHRKLKQAIPVGDIYLRPGRYVELTVKDTGIGMDESTRERIFEPFFTTKEAKDNTGLGLAVAYGIIKQHNGTIEVSSQPREGATFKILLPAIAAKATEEPSVGKTGPIGGRETILLAEDEETVRLPAKSLLEGYGYRVLCAGDGEEAIDLFNQHRDSIDLAIVDLVMPKSSGRQVWEAIQGIRSDVKFLFISGHTATSAHEDFAPPPELPMLSKPFSLFHLAKKVRELLG